MWSLVITPACQVYCIYLFLTWLPSYLRTARHLDLAQTGWLGMAPYLITTVGAVFIGAMSDRLVRRAGSAIGPRKKLMAVLMVLASCVVFVPLTDSVAVMETLIIASVLFVTAANTLNFALAGDLVYDKASGGTVFGLVVLGGNLFGMAAPILTGYIIAVTQAYTLSFALAALLLLLGTVAVLTMVRRPLQSRRTLAPVVAVKRG